MLCPSSKSTWWQSWQCWNPAPDLPLLSLLNLYCESQRKAERKVQDQKSIHIKSRKGKLASKWLEAAAFVKAAPQLKTGPECSKKGFQFPHLFCCKKDKSRESTFFYGQLRLWPIVKGSDETVNHQFSVFKNDLCQIILRGAITAKNTVME